MDEKRLLEIAESMDGMLTAKGFEIDDNETMTEWPTRMARFDGNDGMHVDYTLDVTKDRGDYPNNMDIILDARLYGKADFGIPISPPVSMFSTGSIIGMLEMYVKEDVAPMLETFIKVKKDMILFLHGANSWDVGMIKWEDTSWGAYAYDRFIGGWISAPDLTYAGESALKQHYDPKGELPGHIKLWKTSPVNLYKLTHDV